MDAIRRELGALVGVGDACGDPGAELLAVLERGVAEGVGREAVTVAFAELERALQELLVQLNSVLYQANSRNDGVLVHCCMITRRTGSGPPGFRQ
ncbi:hypothetical protein GCM10027572_34760 [Flexivirga lutea]